MRKEARINISVQELPYCLGSVQMKNKKGGQITEEGGVSGNQWIKTSKKKTGVGTKKGGGTFSHKHGKAIGRIQSSLHKSDWKALKRGNLRRSKREQGVQQGEHVSHIAKVKVKQNCTKKGTRKRHKEIAQE